MLKVVILGTGNLSKHLHDAFTKAKSVDVVQVVGRNQDALQQFSEESAVTDNFNDIAEADVYIIAVKDDVIGEVSRFVASKKGVVAHTSGAMAMNHVQSNRKAVFYPLQTFTKGKTVDFTSIPICIEATDAESFKTLEKLAKSISGNVHHIDSEQRKKLHLAAVFVNNFTNYLYGVGEEICSTEGLSFDLLKPLIKETAEKIMAIPPKKAQTGPARRNDRQTMQSHLELLNNEEHITLYKILSRAIKQAHEEEL
ncbi:MAG: DUF2520 domain-containing protein [Algicola sp.]|nr:DUF2520 domain-containing protein [Algicola sp.]